MTLAHTTPPDGIGPNGAGNRPVSVPVTPPGGINDMTRRETGQTTRPSQ